MIKRQENWREALIKYLGEAAQIPFKAGQHDCAIFAADAVRAMTGVDLAVDWRSTYSTLNGGIAALNAAGFVDQIAMAAEHFEAIPIAFANPGDLAVVKRGKLRALGVVQGANIYLLAKGKGIHIVPLLAAKSGFRVI